MMPNTYPSHLPNSLVLNIAIMTLYILTAKLGLMLAIDPGNVTAIWPPSGIALAAALLFGWRAAGGIWLGSFAVNIWTLEAPFALQMATGIATGSLLQAYITANVLPPHGNKNRFNLPSTSARIFGFMLITALTTSIAPTIGVLSLWAGNQLGDIPLDLFKHPANALWWTWWLGDYAGILIITPLALKLGSSYLKQQSRDSWLLPISSAILGGTLINFFFILQGYVDDYQTKLNQDSLRLKLHIEDILNDQVNQLTALNAFFAASENVERNDFSIFAKNLLRNQSMAQVLEWIPAITAIERPAFEKLIRNTLQSDFQIYEKTTTNQRLPAGQRNWYYPVLYIEPFAGNEAALGYDLGSELVRLNTLNIARDSGKPAATGNITPVQNSKTPSILLISPVYKKNTAPTTVEERRTALIGFHLALFQIKPLIERAIQQTGLNNIYFVLRDISSGNSSSLLASNYDPVQEETNNNLSPIKTGFNLSFANRNWQLEIRVAHNIFSQSHTDSLWLSLAAGIATMLSVVLYAHGQTEKEAALSHKEMENRQLLESLPDVVIVVDPNGRIIYCNQQIKTILGHNPFDLLGESIDTLIPINKRHEHQQHMQDYRNNPTPRRMGNTTNLYARHADGSDIAVDIQLNTLVYKNNNVTMAVIRDVRQQKAQEKTILDLNQNLEKRIIERTNELTTNQIQLQKVITTLNQRHNNDRRLARLLHDLQASENLAQSAALIEEHLPELMPNTLGNILVETQPGQWLNLLHWTCDKDYIPPTRLAFNDCECLASDKYCLKKCTDNLCPASEAINPQDGGENYYLYCDPRKTAANHRAIVHITGAAPLMEQDISLLLERANDIINQIWMVLANAQLREILKAQALRDGLTGLYNRRFLDDILEKEIARVSRNNLPLGIAILDIDFFKKINDSFGHACGDNVLRTVAMLISDYIRSSDYACRMGGEEFLLIMPDCTPEQAMQRMNGLREKISSANILENGKAVTCSIGVAHYPQQGDNSTTILESADAALYQAKQSGRNRVVIAGEKVSVENTWEI